jgi:hypothetical protein
MSGLTGLTHFRTNDLSSVRLTVRLSVCLIYSHQHVCWVEGDDLSPETQLLLKYTNRPSLIVIITYLKNNGILKPRLPPRLRIVRLVETQHAASQPNCCPFSSPPVCLCRSYAIFINPINTTIFLV